MSAVALKCLICVAGAELDRTPPMSARWLALCAEIDALCVVLAKARE